MARATCFPLILACTTAALIAACSASPPGEEDELGGSGGVGAIGGGGGGGGRSGGGGSGGDIVLDDGGSDDGGVTEPGSAVIVPPGMDPGVPGRFGDQDTGTASIQLLYPATEIVLPRNLNALELHFKPGAGQTLFELRADSPRYTYREYFTCTPLGGGCVHSPSPTFWSGLAAAAAGGSFVQWRLRGLDGGGTVSSSETRTIAFGKEEFRGGIYYWNTGEGANGVATVQRFDYGIAFRRPETFIGPAIAGAATCVGCHAISPDGSRIVVGLDIPSGGYKVFEVATRQQTRINGTPAQGNGPSYYSFSPDAGKLLLGSGPFITERDLSTGAVREVVRPGTQPDWAPSGNAMVYARPSPAPPMNNYDLAGGSIGMMDYVGGQWTNHRVLVPFQGKNNYYPAFAPDERWVIFNRSPSNQSSASSPLHGDLYVVDTSTLQQIKLDRAAQGAPTSWAKWVPGIYSYDNGKRVMWFTYSSTRGYGLRYRDQEKVQLWMAAMDPDRAAGGQDPTFSAIWLPFQSMGGGNHIAQWVTRVVRQPCTATRQCNGVEQCVDEQCIPIIQ